MSKPSKLKLSKDRRNGLLIGKRKASAQRQNYPFSWHRRTLKKLEVGNVNTPVSQPSLSLALRFIPGNYLTLLGARDLRCSAGDCMFRKDKDNGESLKG